MPSRSRRADGTFSKSLGLSMHVNVDICSLCKRVRETSPHVSNGLRVRVCDECKAKL